MIRSSVAVPFPKRVLTIGFSFDFSEQPIAIFADTCIRVTRSKGTERVSSFDSFFSFSTGRA